MFEEFLPEEYHEVFHIKNRLLELGALNAAMSGSGPTVFGIFREKTAAKAAETALKQCYPQTYLANPVGELVSNIKFPSRIQIFENCIRKGRKFL